MQGVKLTINNQINSNMDAMSNQMSAVEKLDVANILIKSGVADLLKSLGIMQEANQVFEGQLKLFKNKKSLISKAQ